MGLLIRLLVIGAVGYAIFRLVRGTLPSFGTPRSRFPCATCKNCRALYDDGVICAYGSKETFKNETHIANCQDYQRGRAG